MGASYGKAETSYENRPTTSEIISDNLERTAYRGHLLMGAGLKYDLSRQLVIGIEVGLRPTFDDLLDGISQAGNPDKNDWFGFGGLTLHYRIGKPDADHDGIVDANDICPSKFGIKKFSGCPDSDGDGIENSKDDCPDTFGSSVLKGCPDSDKDGVADHLDKCPNEKGMMRMNGCPDKDWDLVIDSEDDCPDIAGEIELNGCPIIIKKIIAEAEAAQVIGEKEPLNENIATAAQSVIIQSREEEVREKVNEKGKLTREGFPVFDNIQFAEGSNLFDAETYRILMEISEILPQYPDNMLHISSYAELEQNGVINQGIAGKRVYSCFKYLLQKGIPRTQMVY